MSFPGWKACNFSQSWCGGRGWFSVFRIFYSEAKFFLMEEMGQYLWEKSASDIGWVWVPLNWSVSLGTGDIKQGLPERQRTVGDKDRQGCGIKAVDQCSTSIYPNPTPHNCVAAAYGWNTLVFCGYSTFLPSASLGVSEMWWIKQAGASSVFLGQGLGSGLTPTLPALISGLSGLQCGWRELLAECASEGACKDVVTVTAGALCSGVLCGQ